MDGENFPKSKSECWVLKKQIIEAGQPNTANIYDTLSLSGMLGF